MRPGERREAGQHDLLRSRLDQIIDLKPGQLQMTDGRFPETHVGTVWDGPGMWLGASLAWKHMTATLLVFLAAWTIPMFSSAHAANADRYVHVPSNTGLEGISSNSVNFVVRDGYAAVGDAPALEFVPSNSSCPISGGDGGSQIPSADGKCWIASFAAWGADAREWGYRPDGYTANDGSISGGSRSLSSSSRSCSTSDVGKVLVISGAGVASGALETTISSCSGSAYTLAVSASTTVSGVVWGMGTDNSATLNAAVSAMRNGRLYVPAGEGLLRAAQVVLDHVVLCGPDIPQDRSAITADAGATILLASGTVQPFQIKASVKIQGITFFWPGQGGVSTNPVVYPPLLEDDGVDGLSDFTFEDSNAINAYDFFTQNPASIVMGNLRFLHGNVFAVHRYFSVSNIGETVAVDGMIFNPSVWYPGAVSSPHNLGTWSAQNGEFLYAFGDGTRSVCSSTTAGGFLVGGGTTIVGMNKLVHVSTGALDEAKFSNDTDGNAINQLLVVDAAGSITRTSFDGRFYPSGVFGVTTTNAAFQVSGTCTGGAIGGDRDFSVGGDIIGATGSIFDIEGSQNLNVVVHGNSIFNYADTPRAGSPLYLAYLNNPNATFSLVSAVAFPAFTGTNYKGVDVAQALSVNYVGSSCLSQYYCVNVESTDAGLVNIVGVTAANSQAGTSFASSGTGIVRAVGDVVDKRNPSLDALNPTANPNAAYYLPTANGQTYTFNGSNSSLLIDNMTNSVTSGTVVLPTTPPDGWIMSLSVDANFTLTLSAGAGDVNRCGFSNMTTGQAIRCVFKRGIGPTSPHGAWFSY
jgi:hypothetical protein